MTTSVVPSFEPNRWTGSVLDDVPGSTLPNRSPFRFETMSNFYGLTGLSVELPSSAGWMKPTRALTASVVLASAIGDAELARAWALVSSGGVETFQDQYGPRFEELQDLAVEEGIHLPKPEAKNDFLKFLWTLGFSVRKASLALLDDGSIGATWRDDEWRLDLRFQGNKKIEYVLLDRKNPPAGKTGECGLEGFEIEGLIVSEFLAECRETQFPENTMLSVL